MNAVATMRAEIVNRSESVDHAELLAFVSDEPTRAALASALGPSLSTASITLGGVEDAITSLAHDASPKVLVVDLAGIKNPLPALDRLAEVCAPDTAVITLGDVNDVALYRAFMAAGVSDYLVKPVTPDIFRTCIESAKHKLHGPVPAKIAETSGRIFVVVGARGGVGTTTIASTLAWMFAEEHGNRSILVDLDLYWGATALALDVEPGHGLCEVLESPDRIDSLFVASAAAALSDNLYLLCSEEPLEQPIVVGPGAPRALCTELRGNFERVVIDVPRANPEVLRDCFVEAHGIAIVTDLSLPGLRDAGRILSLAKGVAPSTKTFIVANRAVGTPRSEVTRAEFEKSIGTSITVIVPHDGKAVPTAVNTGKPLPKVAPDSKATIALRELARILGEPAQRQTNGLFAWLRRSISRGKH